MLQCILVKRLHNFTSPQKSAFPVFCKQMLMFSTFYEVITTKKLKKKSGFGAAG